MLREELSPVRVVGIQASADYTPSLFARGPANGYDFAMTNVNVGYDLGRFMPYVAAGVGLAKANSGPSGGLPTSGDSPNNFFSPARRDLKRLRQSASSRALDYCGRLPGTSQCKVNDVEIAKRRQNERPMDSKVIGQRPLQNWNHRSAHDRAH